MRHYYLGPWVWDASDPAFPHYRAPDHTLGLVDLRPVSPTITYGFFATNRPINDSSYESFGNGVDRLEDIVLSGADKIRWSGALRIGPIVGDRLIDALWETLTLHGDPDGDLICLPLMPTHKSVLELHLGGHSLIRAERFTGPDHYAWPRIQALVQRSYRNVRTNGQAEAGLIRALRETSRPPVISPQRTLWGQVDGCRRALRLNFTTAQSLLAHEREVIHSKYLECMRRKLRCPWESLIPAGLPKEKPVLPTTTISESFNQANSTTLGPDLTWTEVTGNAETVDNQVASVNSSVTRANARAEHDLSSADHIAKILIAASGAAVDDITAASCRYAADANTHYSAWARRGDSTQITTLIRVLHGSISSLSSTATAAQFVVGTDTVECEADGSTIRYLINGTQLHSVTDTNIPDSLRCGIMVAGVGKGDNFEATDLVEEPPEPGEVLEIPVGFFSQRLFATAQVEAPGHQQLYALGTGTAPGRQRLYALMSPTGPSRQQVTTLTLAAAPTYQRLYGLEAALASTLQVLSDDIREQPAALTRQRLFALAATEAPGRQVLFVLEEPTNITGQHIFALREALATTVQQLFGQSTVSGPTRQYIYDPEAPAFRRVLVFEAELAQGLSFEAKLAQELIFTFTKGPIQ